MTDGGDWRLQIAERAARELARVSRLSVNAEWRGPALSSTGVAAALVQTLSESLAGPRLDPDALHAAIAGRSGTGELDAGRAGHDGAAEFPAPPSRSPASEARSAGDARRESSRRPSPELGRLGREPQGDPLHPLGLASTSSAPAPDAPISVVRVPDPGSMGRIAPPTAAPSVPPLIPAAVTEPPSFGVSAPLVRQATFSEDAGTDEDDTSTLADRIRRILRDEARRHGIALS